jgi:ATP-dependent RNA helicase SUPV3L1/SUV3
LPAVLNALGLRIIPSAILPPGMFGPVLPPLLARAKMAARKLAPLPPPPSPPLPDNPFAALAVLRRAAS